MKRVLFFIILFISVQTTYAKDYEGYCTRYIPQRTPSGIIASVSGVNGIIRVIASRQIEKAVFKETNSKTKVKIKNFFGVSPTKGEFESFKLSSNNIYLDGIYFSDFIIETICKFNKIKYQNDVLSFCETSALKFSATITQEDINRTLRADKYKKIIDEINSNAAVSVIFKIQDSNIKIKDSSLLITYSVIPKGIFSFSSKPYKLSMNTNLKVQNGQIKLNDIKTTSNKIFDNVLLPVINSLNLFDSDILIDKNTRGRLEVKDVKIQNSKIAISGYLIIPKN